MNRNDSKIRILDYIWHDGRKKIGWPRSNRATVCTVTAILTATTACQLIEYFLLKLRCTWIHGAASNDERAKAWENAKLAMAPVAAFGPKIPN